MIKYRMTDLDIASQKLVPIEKKMIPIDDIDFDDLNDENLGLIKMEIDSVLKFREFLKSSKMTMCQKFVREKNRIKDRLEKEKLVLQQQYDNAILKLKMDLENVKNQQANINLKPISDDFDDELEIYGDSEEEEVKKKPIARKKTVAKKKVTKK